MISSKAHELALQDTLHRIIQSIFREKLLPYRISINNLIFTCENSSIDIEVNNVIFHSISRITIRGNIYLINKKRKKKLMDLKSILNLLKTKLQLISEKEFKFFNGEIWNSYRNTCFAIKTQFITNLLFTRLNKEKMTFLSWVTSFSHINTSLFLEQWASQGHPHHPCNKTKLGFSQQEVLSYSPEFSPTVTVIMAAIHKHISKCEMENPDLSYQQWFRQQFPALHTAWKNELQNISLDHKDYLPLFIHPWQANHIIKKLFNDELKSNNLILLENVVLNTQPSLSFRTLYPLDPNQLQLKLPVSIQATSAMRTVSPASVHNSPQISGVIRKILSVETKIANKLVVLLDSVGLRINKGNPDTDKQLSILYRDNMNHITNEKETAVVTAALFQQSPINTCPLLIEMVDSLKTHITVIDYFHLFSKNLIAPYLTLYLKYGIGLEAHQQNTFIVFSNNFPIKSVYRDLGGIRIHSPTLSKRGYSLQAFPNSATITNNLAEVRNKVIHTLFQSILGESIIHLSLHYSIPETELWHIVYENVISTMTQLESEGACHHVPLEVEKKAIINDDWPIKSLLTMRLNNTYSTYIYNKTDNPLKVCSHVIKVQDPN